MRYHSRSLEAAYRAYEDTLPIVPVGRHSQIDANLVTFKDNANADDAHSWFHFKEGFSSRLLVMLLQELDIPQGRHLALLDPFAGVGTTLLSAQLAQTRGWRLDAVGVELNPFLCFVIDAKLDWYRYDPERVRALIDRVLKGGADRFHGDLPQYSTLLNPRVYHPLRLRSLLGYREKIRRLAGGQPEERFLLLGLASILEAVSGVRKDGRGLRFVPNKQDTTPREALRGKWCRMLRSLEQMRSRYSSLNPARLVEGDARELELLDVGLAEKFGLMIYSPPYLNNIDYTEVYKIELWMLGFVRTEVEFRELKRSTIQSHPSVAFQKDGAVCLPGVSTDLLEKILAAAPADESDWRRELFRGYAIDMYEALEQQFCLLKDNAYCICVVGNSLHGGRSGRFPVATDLLITSLAQSVGYQVKKILIARHLRRRDREANWILRESIIILQKPGPNRAQR